MPRPIFGCVPANLYSPIPSTTKSGGQTYHLLQRRMNPLLYESYKPCERNILMSYRRMLRPLTSQSMSATRVRFLHGVATVASERRDGRPIDLLVKLSTRVQNKPCVSAPDLAAGWGRVLMGGPGGCSSWISVEASSASGVRGVQIERIHLQKCMWH